MKTVSNSDADINLFNGTIKNCREKKTYVDSVVVFSRML